MTQGPRILPPLRTSAPGPTRPGLGRVGPIPSTSVSPTLAHKAGRSFLEGSARSADVVSVFWTVLTCGMPGVPLRKAVSPDRAEEIVRQLACPRCQHLNLRQSRKTRMLKKGHIGASPQLEAYRCCTGGSGLHSLSRRRVAFQKPGGCQGLRSRAVPMFRDRDHSTHWFGCSIHPHGFGTAWRSFLVPGNCGRTPTSGIDGGSGPCSAAGDFPSPIRPAKACRVTRASSLRTLGQFDEPVGSEGERLSDFRRGLPDRMHLRGGADERLGVPCPARVVPIDSRKAEGRGPASPALSR